MRKIEMYKIVNFQSESEPDFITTVPVRNTGAIVKPIILPDGIYVCYDVEDSERKDRNDTFHVGPPDKEIPDGFKVVGIVDAVVQVDDKQGIVVYVVSMKDSV